MSSLGVANSAMGSYHIQEPQHAKDYIGAVDELLSLCRRGANSTRPEDFVGQVQKVQSHIEKILVSNGVE